MPSSVAVSVRNCAIAKQTLAAMSLPSLMSIEVNASATATANDTAAIVFSRIRFIELRKESERRQPLA